MEPTSFTFRTTCPEHPTLTFTAKTKESKEEFFARCKQDILKHQEEHHNQVEEPQLFHCYKPDKEPQQQPQQPFPSFEEEK